MGVAVNLSDVKIGQIVKHYKLSHGHYEIIAIGRDSERCWRRLIGYRSLRTGEIWFRPAAPADKITPEEDAFCELVDYNGKTVERFRDIGINAYEEIKADAQGRLVVYNQANGTAYLRHHYQESGQFLLIQQPRIEISTTKGGIIMKCGDPDCPNPDAKQLTLAPFIANDDEATPPPLFLCMPCVRRLDLWCDKHQLIHTGFQSGGHACLPCIEEDVALHRAEAVPLADRLRAAMTVDAWDDMQNWADMAGSIMSDQSIEITILRALLTTAHRRALPLEQVVEAVCVAKSAADILPSII
jgi:hypothetical protein